MMSVGKVNRIEVKHSLLLFPILCQIGMYNGHSNIDLCYVGLLMNGIYFFVSEVFVCTNQECVLTRSVY